MKGLVARVVRAVRSARACTSRPVLSVLLGSASSSARTGVTGRLFGRPECRGQRHVKWATAVDDAGTGQCRSESEGGCHPAVCPPGGALIPGSSPGTRYAEPPFPRLPRLACRTGGESGRTEGSGRSQLAVGVRLSDTECRVVFVVVSGDAIRDGRPCAAPRVPFTERCSPCIARFASRVVVSRSSKS